MLSGPMRGIPEYNYPQFFAVEEALTYYLTADGAVSHDDGWTLLNPARSFDGELFHPIEAYMKKSLDMAVKADVIVLLPGWKVSQGTNAEINVGIHTGAKFWSAIPNTACEEGWEFNPVNVVDELDKLSIPSGKLAPVGRNFDTGAYRDTEEGKLDYEGFLSPMVLYAYAEYMHRHRVQSNGEMRPADNWQRGIPKDVYMKSMWRHFMDVWQAHRNVPLGTPPQMEALMALLFNVMGYAYELLQEPEGF